VTTTSDLAALFGLDAVWLLDAIRGLVVTLAPGMVNAQTRHPSDAPWYRPGRSGARSAPRPRLPAVVTCPRGHDSLVERVPPGEAQVFPEEAPD
jgi:hypothetical protein